MARHWQATGLGVILALLVGTPDRLGAQVPRDTVRWTLSFQGRVSGAMHRWAGADGSVGFFLEYNDRGRGPRTTSLVALDPRGWPTAITVDGVDYRKNPVAVRWTAPGGPPAAFNTTGLDPWMAMPLLARAVAASPGRTVPVDGAENAAATARVAHREPVRSDDGREQVVSLVALSWGGAVRGRIWVDTEGELFAVVGWQSLVRQGWQAALPSLILAEERLAAGPMAASAAELLRRPALHVAVTNVNLVDVNTSTIRPGTTILMRESRIVATGPDGTLRIPAGTHLVDGAGRWALPGLWEMHAHHGGGGDQYARSRMAQGILAARDLVGTLPAVHSVHRRREAVRAGREVGLEMVLSGFIDGPAENTGPTSVLVSTEDSARSAVRGYAAMGYDQIKTYSSLDPRLLPAIVDEAARHGLRVSGHIPAFMTAEQAVRAGMSEVNHANFLMLNFFGDTIDTRGTDRFYVPMEQWPSIEVASPRVQAFVRLLRERSVVVDPTLCIFRAQWGQPGGFPARNGYTLEHYRQGYRRMEELVMELWRGGVRLVAGTDNACAVQDELAIYAGMGIPAWDLLRMATIDAAVVTGRARELGSIVPGKTADFILLDGDPSADIANTARVSLVVKGGVPLAPERIRGATEWP